MNAVPVSAIFAAAAALSGEVVDPNGSGSTAFVPDADTLARLTARLNEHLPKIWNAAAWPEVTHTEQWRMFGAAWFTAGISPVRGQVVIDPEANLPYLCLATPVAAPGVGLVVPPVSDTTKWLQLRSNYSEFQEWSASGVFTAGTVVRYQAQASGQWYVGLYVAAIAPSQGSTPPTPVPGLAPSSSGWLRIDTLPLVFTIPAGVGDILNVYPQDPREYRVDPLLYTLNDQGVRVAGNPGSAWFTYRDLCPYLFGAPWDEAANYVAGSQIYFVTGGVGDFYEVLSDTVAGQSPVTDPLLFERVEIPRRFAVYLGAKVAADWLRWDGQSEKASDPEAAALLEWDRLFLQLRQQKQARPMNVRTRGFQP